MKIGRIQFYILVMMLILSGILFFHKQNPSRNKPDLNLTVNSELTHSNQSAKEDPEFLVQSADNKETEKMKKRPIDTMKKGSSFDSLNECIREVHHSFNAVLGSLNKVKQSEVLSELNRKSEPWIPNLIRILESESVEKNQSERLAIVDYFRYRMRWDLQLRAQIFDLSRWPLAEDLVTRGNQLAERAELGSEFILLNQSEGRNLVKSINDEDLRRLMVSEMYSRLLEANNTSEYAKVKILEIDPKFLF